MGCYTGPQPAPQLVGDPVRMRLSARLLSLSAPWDCGHPRALSRAPLTDKGLTSSSILATCSAHSGKAGNS